MLSTNGFIQDLWVQTYLSGLFVVLRYTIMLTKATGSSSLIFAIALWLFSFANFFDVIFLADSMVHFFARELREALMDPM